MSRLKLPGPLLNCWPCCSFLPFTDHKYNTRKSSCVNARGLPAVASARYADLSLDKGEVPHPVLMGGTPILILDVGTPHQQDGVPPSRPGIGYPPVQTWTLPFAILWMRAVIRSVNKQWETAFINPYYQISTWNETHAIEKQLTLQHFIVVYT